LKIEEAKTMFDKAPDIMTFKECQQYLKVGKNTLLRLLHDKKIETFRIGNRWKIPRAAVVEYIKYL